jgi:hypothetical protein
MRGAQTARQGLRVEAKVFSLRSGIQKSNKTFSGDIVLDEKGD